MIIFILFILLINTSYYIWPYISDALRSFFTKIPYNFGLIALFPALIAVFRAFFLTLLEAIDHKSLKYVKSSFLKGAVLWTTYYSISFFALLLSSQLVKSLNISPVFNFNDLKLYGLEVLIFFIGVDFFYYWFHRSQHEFPVLWKFHEFHHSIENLTAANSTHHWSEEYFRIIPYTLPVAILFQGTAENYMLVTAFILSWAGYIHCNSPRAALPNFLKYFVVDNRFHFAHHGKGNEYKNKNFGAFIPLWDVIFKTHYFSDEEKLPETGVEGKSEPNVIGFLKFTVPNDN